MPETFDPLVIDYAYGNDGWHAYAEEGTYADPTAQLPTTVSVNSAHSLGEVVTSAIRAGLRIEHLEEHLEVLFDPRGGMIPAEADGMVRWRLGGEGAPPLPLMYTLIAGRPMP
jgi:hypothetical protein